MSLLLISSILIRITAVVWAGCIWHRLRDWRMGFFTAMFALMVTRPLLALCKGLDDLSLQLAANVDEIPGLLVSVLALLAVFYLGQMISERHKAETYRQHTQKMDALGRLAGGVAHDFKNLLTVIQGFADMLRRDLDKGTPGPDAAMEIVDLRAQLRAEQPSIASILISGYLKRSERAEDALNDTTVCLAKPFGPAKLRVAIDEGRKAA